MYKFKVNDWVTINKPFLIKGLPRHNQLSMIINIVENRCKVQFYYLDKTKAEWSAQWFDLDQLTLVKTA